LASKRNAARRNAARNAGEDTQALEAERFDGSIDRMVYKLYELTDEEIAVVEGR
jgi:hypothetical protein